MAMEQKQRQFELGQVPMKEERNVIVFRPDEFSKSQQTAQTKALADMLRNTYALLDNSIERDRAQKVKI